MRVSVLATVAGCGLLVAAGPRAQEQSPLDLDFRAKVATLLEKRCLSCHGGDTPKAGLSLATRKRVLTGGDGGPAIVPGKPDDSLLLKMISGPKPKMPLKAAPLSSAEVAIVRQWIAAGAAWPEPVVLKDRRFEGGTWWSLQTLKRPAVPSVKNLNWVRTPIDAFILQKLEERGLAPSAEADRRTLIRRLTFDLHGLPPTPEQVDAFVSDASPDGYERLVDRLLASPHYGERWARHWLDVVHYGDTHGYDKDKRRNNAWPYRDYVIRSFNADKPYARFVTEQLAGDKLISAEPDGIIATGFIAAGPWDFVGHVELREGTVDKEKTRLIDRDDMVASAVSTFVSLTALCARCHDHKFDPIPQRDYYKLQAVFAGIERGDRAYLKMPRVPPPLVQVYAAVPRAPRPIHVLHRGDVEQRGDQVWPGALVAISGLKADFGLADSTDEAAGRVALAEWVTHPLNPLTWRSIVNRVWHYHFGKGIVDTPNDFGRMGGQPSHPELLDWLAVEFRDGGKSFKKLHKMIVMSAAFRQSSVQNPAAARLDNDNRLLWRMHRLRLDAESIRDSVLAVSGQLDLRMGGPGFEVFRFRDDHSPEYDHTALEKIHDPRTYRRTIYRFTVRSVPNPLLDCLDCADPNQNVPVRNTTLTALQALALLNDPFMIRQSEHLAERLTKSSSDTGEQMELAFRLLFGRAPTAEDKAELTAYAARHGMVAACRLMFNANEFVFVD